jgi:hypothetical protein
MVFPGEGKPLHSVYTASASTLVLDIARNPDGSNSLSFPTPRAPPVEEVVFYLGILSLPGVLLWLLFCARTAAA